MKKGSALGNSFTQMSILNGMKKTPQKSCNRTSAPIGPFNFQCSGGRVVVVHSNLSNTLFFLSPPPVGARGHSTMQISIKETKPWLGHNSPTTQNFTLSRSRVHTGRWTNHSHKRHRPQCLIKPVTSL